MKILVKDKKHLAGIEIEQIVNLLIATWPQKDGIVNIENMVEDYKKANLNTINKSILCYNGEELIGHTEIFNREIVIENKEKQILALAGVCVKPNFRGKNIGMSLVKQAFQFVDNGQFMYSLFQTNVPEFYEKINCKQIDNKFINSRNENDININPWRDPYVMLYPSSYELGESIVDLKGEGY